MANSVVKTVLKVTLTTRLQISVSFVKVVFWKKNAQPAVQLRIAMIDIGTQQKNHVKYVLKGLFQILSHAYHAKE